MKRDKRRWPFGRKRREQERRRRKRRRLGTAAAAAVLAVLGVCGYFFWSGQIFPRASAAFFSGRAIPEWIDVQIIPRGNPSRTGRKLAAVNDIAVHYVGNPGTTAQQNRNFYGNLNSDVSSHFIVGLEGEIIMCLPLNEKSSATNQRNIDTISIETCHPDESGRYTDVTYAAEVRLTAWLLQQYGLDESHIIRHYDVTGKECPRYFVTHEDAWERFKADVAAALAAMP